MQPAQLLEVWLEGLQVAACTKRLIAALKCVCRCQQLRPHFFVLFGELGHAVINRMMGYVPDLHRIWVNTSDQQLMALSREFPGFYRYARIMEEASDAERNKASRPYDGMGIADAFGGKLLHLLIHPRR